MRGVRMLFDGENINVDIDVANTVGEEAVEGSSADLSYEAPTSAQDGALSNGEEATSASDTNNATGDDFNGENAAAESANIAESVNVATESADTVSENIAENAAETVENIEETSTDETRSAEIVEDENDFEFAKPKIVYHLSDYDGPLDLLYQQIKDAKIAIEDIFISDITSQYVEIIKNTPKEEFDYAYAGEFITMAAELVYLKSIRTLPRDEDEEITEDDPEYERQLFINKLKEYALLKEESAKLRELETVNRFYRAPVYSEKDYRVALVNFSLPKLVEAFARILANAERREQEIIPKKVLKERFSVHDQMLNIRDVIAERLRVQFTDLLMEDYSKADIVTTFLAVLELVKYGVVGVEQEEAYDVIWLNATDMTDDESIEFLEDEDGKY